MWHSRLGDSVFSFYLALDINQKRNSILYIALLVFHVVLTVHAVLSFIEAQGNAAGRGYIAVFNSDSSSIDATLAAVSLASVAETRSRALSDLQASTTDTPRLHLGRRVVILADLVHVGAFVLCFRQWRWSIYTDISENLRKEWRAYQSVAASQSLATLGLLSLRRRY